MSELREFVFSMFPLFLIPLSLGRAVLGSAAPHSSRWWFALILTGLYFLIAHGIHLPGVAAFGGFWGLLAFACIRAFNSRKDWKKEFPGEISFWEAVPYALLAALILAPGYANTLAHPVSLANWDAVAIWHYKVKGLLEWTSFVNTPVPGWPYVNYPHLGPVLEMWVIKLAGTNAENYGRLLLPTCYFFWAAALVGLIKTEVKNGLAALVAVPVGALFFDLRSFISGYQDGFLAVCAGMAAVHFCRFLRRDLLGKAKFPAQLDWDLLLGFFFAGSACLIKAEGSILSFVLCASFLIIFLTARLKRAKLREAIALWPYAAVFAGLFVLWPCILLVNGLGVLKMQNAFTFSDVSQFSKNLNRWPVISQHVGFYFEKTRLVLAASALASIASSWLVPQSRRSLAFLWVFLLIHCAVVPLPYFVTRLNLNWHLANSFDRLMSHHFFAYAAILSIAGAHLVNFAISSKGRTNRA